VILELIVRFIFDHKFDNEIAMLFCLVIEVLIFDCFVIFEA
jgi:hypothetical protein